MRKSEVGFNFIVGSMFGFKTSEMIHLLNLETEMKRKVQAFKVPWDNRYGYSSIVAHNGMEYPAISVPNTSGLIKQLKKSIEVIGIDEIQFFDEDIIDFILENRRNYLIIATALQMDFRGNSFPLRSPKGKEYDSERHVGELMPFAKLTSRYPQCTYETNGKFCRTEAEYTQRWNADGTLSRYEDQTVVIGGSEKYAPRCIEHFIEPKPD